jgi:hypothetical protein
MNLRVGIGLATVCLACATFSSFGQTASSTSRAPQQQQPLPKPTNLQVLPKDIAPEDLMKLMHGYSDALGVHCNFCHEVDAKTHHPNFAADTKPDKTIARTMIAMTQEINTKFMTQINDPDATPADKTVACGTCHRGNTMPAPFIPKPEAHDGHHPANAMPMPKSQ